MTPLQTGQLMVLVLHLPLHPQLPAPSLAKILVVVPDSRCWS